MMPHLKVMAGLLSRHFLSTPPTRSLPYKSALWIKEQKKIDTDVSHNSIIFKSGWYYLSFTCAKNVTDIFQSALCIPHTPSCITFLILTYSTDVGHKKKLKQMVRRSLSPSQSLGWPHLVVQSDIYSDSPGLTCSAGSGSPQWKTFTKRF